MKGGTTSQEVLESLRTLISEILQKEGQMKGQMDDKDRTAYDGLLQTYKHLRKAELEKEGKKKKGEKKQKEDFEQNRIKMEEELRKITSGDYRDQDDPNEIALRAALGNYYSG